jgi:hypothetical protein
MRAIKKFRNGLYEEFISDAELRASEPRVLNKKSEWVPHFDKLRAGFPAGFARSGKC